MAARRGLCKTDAERKEHVLIFLKKAQQHQAAAALIKIRGRANL